MWKYCISCIVIILIINCFLVGTFSFKLSSVIINISGLCKWLIKIHLVKPFLMEKYLMNVPSSNSPNAATSTSMQRWSLNISHFNALHNAISNLARIDDFDLEKVGSGYYAEVFKATHKQTGQVLALKRNLPTNTKLNILREIQLMNRLSHPNLLKHEGVCVHQGQLHALTEFASGGDLEKFLTGKKESLTWEQRVSMALDIARGMKYLHSVGIFHRDLSAKNCLVLVKIDRGGKKQFTCVVADLGLAEKIPTTPEEEESLALVGTPYVIAPEVLMRKPYNEKSDVFSFGLLVCQLIALVSSDPEELPRRRDFGLAGDLFQDMVSVSTSPFDPPFTSFPPPNSFLQLALDCCEYEPGSRPTFDEVVPRLEAMLRAEKKRCRVDSSLYKEMHLNSSRPMKKADLPAQKNNSKMENGSASSPKLSRAYSDITRELIQHAKSVVESSAFNDTMNERDPFHNPFEALEDLNCGRIKFVDEPSLALLELTFDLATSESLKTSSHKSVTSRRPRPKSICAVGRHSHVEEDLLRDPRVHELQTTETDGASRSPRLSCSEEILTQCDDCNLQRARHRAMILSPLGSHLAQLWSNHHRGVCDDSSNQRRTMATLMSVMSRGLLGVRRSISVPDLSRSSSLFHHVDQEAETRILHALDLTQNQTRSHSIEESNSDEAFTCTHATPKVPVSPLLDDNFNVILKTGEVTRLYRKSTKQLSKVEIAKTSPTRKSYSRDSGYEDSSLDDHSHFSPSSPRHVTFDIPEEEDFPIES